MTNQDKKIETVFKRKKYSEMTQEEKQAYLDKMRNDMILDDERGPCFIPEKYKEDGYTYRIVDTTRPGRVNYLEKVGYEVVENPDAQVGDNTTKSISNIGSTVDIQLGGSHGKNRQGILMRIPTEVYNLRQQLKQKKVDESEASLGKTGIPTQTGEITIGSKTIK